MIRTITFTVNDINGNPEEGAVLVFQLKEYGTATDAPIYLRQGKKADPTDASGLGSIDLWVNEESEKLSIYQVKYPSGEADRFIIPAGVGDIDLSDLVINYNPDDVAAQTPQSLSLKADKDAGNILAPEALAWQTALDIETTAELDARDTANRDRSNHTGGPDDLDGNDITSVGAVEFDTAAPSATTTIGATLWNPTDQTIETIISANTRLQHGRELLTRVRNSTGSLIPNGKIVRISGSTGGVPNIVLAQADSIANVDGVIGIVTDDIANNTNGDVCIYGLTRMLDTSGELAGEEVYVSPTSAGDWTDVEPDISIKIGTVQTSNPSNGTILVRVQNNVRVYILASNPSSVGGFDSSAWLDAIGISPSTVDQFLVSTGAGTWTFESGDDAQKSLGVQSSIGGGQVGSGSSATSGFAGGSSAISSASNAVQLGFGTNSTAGTIQFLGSGAVTATQFGYLSTLTSAPLQTSNIGSSVQAYSVFLGSVDQNLGTLNSPSFSGLEIYGQALLNQGIRTSTTPVTTTTYTALTTDNKLIVNDDTAGAAVTIDVMTPATAGDGFELTFYKNGTTAPVFIDGIETNSVILYEKGDSIKITTDGSEWFIIEA